VDDAMALSLDTIWQRDTSQMLTAEAVRGISDGDVEQAVFEYASAKIGEDYRSEVAIIRSLAPGVRALYATWQVETEVRDGGFSQFFWNPSWDYAVDAAEGFEFFGLPELAALMRDAIQVHKAEAAALRKPAAHQAPADTASRLQPAELDERFHKLSALISAARVKRIREQPELFAGA